MKRILFALLLCAQSGVPAFAAETPADKPAVENSCPTLPSPLKFDGGKLVLERQGTDWKIVKGVKTPPRDFVYPDEDKRIFRFRYWTNRVYRCTDTGRIAN